MNILFDFEIKYSNVKMNLLPDKMKEFFEMVREFAFTRLKVLEDEINLYPEGVIIIHTLSKDERKHGISYSDFPKDLSDKMMGCVSNEDIIYLYNKWENKSQ